ncbi:aminotransferase class III-fold pyridoxal phosphate-dependent enzyme [Kribbella sp. NPDC048915]|uniref:aminotransferase class III-fold pyridoxal phosphate-dependent enzyme n=1 Tax=Kribbella sp. NPDC048915 TaxID=3155148 RepID=UPI0033D901B8
MDVMPERTPSMVADPPEVDVLLVDRLLRQQYGVDAVLTELRSERDRNFLAESGTARWVVKVSNSGDDSSQIAMECAAMRHVELVDPGFPIPRVLPATAGGPVTVLRANDGRMHQVRVITTLPGDVGDLTALPSWFPGEFGAVCARLAKALESFGHPAAYRRLDWDPRLVSSLQRYVEHVPDVDRQALLQALTDRFARLPEATQGLPSSVFHGDVTLSNVLMTADRITGVIDFGDMHHTARVADLAISLTSLLRESDDLWSDARQFLDAYQRELPLEPAEVDVLGELVLARCVASILISAWRAPLYPENEEYLTSLVSGSWRVLDELADLDRVELAGRFHRLCGTLRVTTTADPALLVRRKAVLGGDLSPLFYREPLQPVRAEGAWIHTADGRRYLDAYNNVPVVGHAHPAVVQAISRQAAVLNLNSRYLHPHAVELAERLVASMPDGLDTCVFVNSGSEANDLAWRMARLATGGSGAIVADLAYHGVSEATAAWSTNTYPPSARPPHIATFEAPRSGEGGAEAHARVRAAAAELWRSGHQVALLAVDSVFSSAGILTPSDDFMRGLQDEVRSAGGLFLADEVQAGFGRGGRNLWRFLDFGLTPDFVTLGKPMGNGHPVAALITRRELAERFAAVDEFFSTFAGNPVSCVAALTVLDVIEQTGLVERSGALGELLRAGIAAAAPEAVVRGQGLMVGVEVPDAAGFAERLREYGVLVGTTGPAGGVLKIRPPLIWTEAEVEYFLRAFGYCWARA